MESFELIDNFFQIVVLLCAAAAFGTASEPESRNHAKAQQQTDDLYEFSHLNLLNRLKDIHSLTFYRSNMQMMKSSARPS